MAELSLSRSQLLLLAGTANRPLAEEMAGHLGQPLCALTIRRFADGEIFVKIDENVRGRDVFIIQPTNPPAENLVELLLMIDAARRASAARITAVLPHFRYPRQEPKEPPRAADRAQPHAKLITHARGQPAALKRLGARKIYAFASHALLSGPAVERLRAAPIDEVAVTNTIHIPDERRYEKLQVLSIADLMAKAIGYEHSNQSVSSLFD